ncbi:bifunctional 2-polyprenyl-6-hydroxyphenol methylase/3-demethylubiquinol 3-O-methyltransferase UbiG [Paucisalibacillus sp. EB02]|uniref:class I SAM-dependent methyltransferase n=1 Tax=Paucisalibacillus sp. EB02 TaxID=1347087 RepID=UPI0005A7A3E8|nr:class I SAM-dependent methyltransferase [Paucisalibacillus sp. EB02]
MTMRTNLEEYDNPELYDFENNGYSADVSFLLKWAEQVDGVIVDLACGTGRATLPLAEKGHLMIGVDIHTGMLEQAKKKSSNLPVKWVEQDCTALRLDVTSKMIYMVGNSFQHFLTNMEQDQLLSAVHHHLEDNGIFIFGTRFPNKEELLQPAIEEFWRSYRDPSSGEKVDVYTISEYDALKQIQHYTTIRKAQDGSESRTGISLRYVYPQEMQRLAEANGFSLLHMFSDWHESPISSDSLEMICVLQKKG